ncbi:MAG: two-component system cell cycle response regulator [Alteromonadaceae bacterium]|jgi:two-component system cell cycle response regulator
MKNIRLPYKIFNFTGNHPLFLNILRKPCAFNRASLALVKQVQTTTEPEVLLSLFLKELEKYLPICTLNFHNDIKLFSNKNDLNSVFCLEQNLSVDDNCYGKLSYTFYQKLTRVQVVLLKQLSELVTYPLFNALKYKKMQHLALKDNLTGLSNRNNFELAFAKSVNTCLAQKTSFSLLIIDLDGFKQINDAFGHKTGDMVLSCFGKILRDCCREQDQVFRFGGDEFTILLNDTKKASIFKIAKRIQKRVASNSFLMKFTLSCSIGSAHYQQNDPSDVLFCRADKALYKAKERGKNCLELSPCAQ